MKQRYKNYSDVNLLQREYHNRNKFAVIFTRDTTKDTYVLSAGKALGPIYAQVNPDEFLYLPHGYYFIKGFGVPNGEPIQMLMNLEDAMMKGIKVPSNHYGLCE